LSKIIGLGSLLVTLVLALACGGGDGSNARSITGYIDSNAVTLSKANTDDGTYEVWALYNGVKVQKGTVTKFGKKDSYDSEYKIDNLVDGTVYTVNVYKTLDSEVTTVMSTVVVANAAAASNVSTKARFAKKAVKGQINAVTTYIAEKFAQAGATATVAGLESFMTVTMGLTAGSTPSDIYTDNGVVSSTAFTVPTSIVSVATVYYARISAIANATTATAMASKVTSYASSITSIVAAVPGSDALFSVVQTAIKVTLVSELASIASLLPSAIQSVQSIVATATGTSFSSVDTAVKSVNTTTVADVTVTSFGLADTTYGSASGSTYKVGTLAPVFKVTTSSAFTGTFSDYVTVSVKGASTLTTTDLSNLVKVSSSTDGLTHYVMVIKDATPTSSSTELNPGSSYDLSISAVSGKTVSFTGTGLSSTGTATITVSKLTMTLPFTGTGSYNESQVALAGTTYAGVTGSSTTLYLNSKDGIAYSTAAGQGYDIFGASEVISVTMGSSTTPVDFTTLSAISLGKITESSTGVATAIPVTVTSLVSGPNSLKLTAGTGSVSVGGVSTTGADVLALIPQTSLTITKQ
jgi:hypothetical protein